MTSLKIMKIAGIDIRIHFTWLFIFGLLTLSLATAFFPAFYEFDQATNWILAVLASILLFVSVLLHELSHSIVSQKNNIPVRSITLFFFGGVADISTEDITAREELEIAAAGPAMSILLGGIFYLLYLIDFGVHATSVFDYLFRANLILAVFNLVPGFPLDGGRIFRAILRNFKSMVESTRIASNFGKGVGYILMGVGIVSIFYGGFGIWYIFLGYFLVMLARTSYQQVVIKHSLKKVDVKELVNEVPLVEKDWTLKEFAQWCEENNVTYGIVKNGGFYIIDFDDVSKVPARDWDIIKVAEVMKETKPVSIKKDANEMFSKLVEGQTKALPVVENKKYLGIISRDTFINVLRLRSAGEAF
jgi:Zn-dependent protease